MYNYVVNMLVTNVQDIKSNTGRSSEAPPRPMTLPIQNPLSLSGGDHRPDSYGGRSCPSSPSVSL